MLQIRNRKKWNFAYENLLADRPRSSKIAVKTQPFPNFLTKRFSLKILANEFDITFDLNHSVPVAQKKTINTTNNLPQMLQ